ncbi:MAG: PH domain-containing protein [Bryobacteraceae bacterium]|nr:PH domain-containing protein [Bryobacteraceae bacterium]
MSQTPAGSASSVVVRPSFRLVRPLYTVGFILAAVLFGWNNNRPDPQQWLLIIPVLILLLAVRQHIGQHFTSLTVGGGKLRYETGLFSKSTRTMDLAKIQDVRVDQSLWQRMFGIGNLGLETAGETGGLAMNNVDRPQAVAEYILGAAGK